MLRLFSLSALLAAVAAEDAVTTAAPAANAATTKAAAEADAKADATEAATDGDATKAAEATATLDAQTKAFADAAAMSMCMTNKEKEEYAPCYTELLPSFTGTVSADCKKVQDKAKCLGDAASTAMVEVATDPDKLAEFATMSEKAVKNADCLSGKKESSAKECCVGFGLKGRGSACGGTDDSSASGLAAGAALVLAALFA